MIWALSSNCIDEIYRLLSLYLGWYVCDEILEIQNCLEYRVSTLTVSNCRGNTLGKDYELVYIQYSRRR